MQIKFLQLFSMLHLLYQALCVSALMHVIMIGLETIYSTKTAAPATPFSKFFLIL